MLLENTKYVLGIADSNDFTIDFYFGTEQEIIKQFSEQYEDSLKDENTIIGSLQAIDCFIKEYMDYLFADWKII